MNFIEIPRCESINIDFNLTGSGWAEAVISTDEWSTVLYGGCSGDNVVDLMHELYYMYAENRKGFIVKFDNEPDASSITVSNTNAVAAELKMGDSTLYKLCPIETNTDLLIEIEPEADDEDIIKFIIPFNAFARAVVIAVDRMLDKHGFIGYDKTWSSGRGIDISAYIFAKKVAAGTWQDASVSLGDDTYSSNLEAEIELIRSDINLFR